MYDLSSPFLITFIATVVGLFWHFVLGRYYDRGVSEMTGDERDQNFMTKEDRELRKSIRDLPFSDLWNRAVATQATEEQLHTAIEIAPKRHLLVRLVFSFECSKLRRQIVGLQEQTFMGLRAIAEEKGIDQMLIKSCLNAKRHPKRQLILEIIKAGSDSYLATTAKVHNDVQGTVNPLAEEDDEEVE